MKLITLSIGLLLFVGCAAENPLQRGGRSLKDKIQDGLGSTGTPEEVFNDVIMPLFQRDCNGCHDAGTPVTTFQEAIAMVTAGDPATSELYLRATGTNHRKKWDPISDEAKALATWITSL